MVILYVLTEPHFGHWITPVELFIQVSARLKSEIEHRERWESVRSSWALYLRLLITRCSAEIACT